MQLRGIEFGRVWDAAGVRGFFGEGYAHHRWLGPLRPKFAGSTFVAKTTTLHANAGNMPLRGDLSPKEHKPACIVVRPFSGVVLNAVGLSGPGAEALFDTGAWQRRTEPFFLSFMSIKKTASERLKDLEGFVAIAAKHLGGFAAPVGLQMNFSCPNVGVKSDGLAAEVYNALSVAGSLGIPLVPKFNVLLEPQLAARISERPECDAICVSNSLPWGALDDFIGWKSLFGTERSPLAHLGGGGLSGKPLYPLTLLWLSLARQYRVRCPLNIGGGIMDASDAAHLLRMGADSVFIGSVAILRPWRVAEIIRTAQTIEATA